MVGLDTERLLQWIDSARRVALSEESRREEAHAWVAVRERLDPARCDTRVAAARQKQHERTRRHGPRQQVIDAVCSQRWMYDDQQQRGGCEYLRMCVTRPGSRRLRLERRERGRILRLRIVAAYSGDTDMRWRAA